MPAFAGMTINGEILQSVPKKPLKKAVIPAQAGIPFSVLARKRDARFRGHDDQRRDSSERP
jgi:hypothetical protein